MDITVYVVVCLYLRCPGERKRSSVQINAETNGGTATWIRLTEGQITNLPVHIAKRPLWHMGIRIESIALTSATLPTDSEVATMTKEQMEKENMYQATMMIAKNLLNKGVISEEEYAQIDTNFKAKYQISLSTLFTDIRLIKYDSYGNM